MKKLLLIAVTTATILSSAISFAECDVDTNTSIGSSSENQWYLKLNVGGVIFNKVKPNTGFIGNIGAGYYIMDNLRADFTIGTVTNNHLKKSKTVTSSSGNITYTDSIKHKPTIVSVLLNGYVDFVDLSMFKVFAGAGVGPVFVKEKISYKETEIFQGQKQVENFPNINTKSKTNFAYQVSLGTSFEVAPGMKAELVYSWRDYGKTKTKKVDGITEGGTRYRSNNLIAGLRFDM